MLEILDASIQWALVVLLIITVIVVPILSIDSLGKSSKLFTSVPRGTVCGIQDPGGHFVRWIGNIPDHFVDMHTGRVVHKDDPDAKNIEVAARIPFFGFKFMGWNPLLIKFNPGIKYETTSSEAGQNLKAVSEVIDSELPFQETVYKLVESVPIDAADSIEGLQTLLLDVIIVAGVRSLRFDSVYGILSNTTSPWPSVVGEALESAVRSIIGNEDYQGLIKGEGLVPVASKIRLLCQDKIDQTYDISRTQVPTPTTTPTIPAPSSQSTTVPTKEEELRAKAEKQEAEDAKKDPQRALKLIMIQIAQVKVSSKNPQAVLDAFAKQNTIDIEVSVKTKQAQGDLKVAQLAAQGNAAKIKEITAAFEGDTEAAAAYLNQLAFTDAMAKAENLIVTTGGSNGGTPPIILDNTRRPNGDKKDEPKKAE